MKGKSPNCLVCVNLAPLGGDDIKTHILTHHVHSVFLCDLCHRIFVHEDDVNEHVASAHLKHGNANLEAVKLESIGAFNANSHSFDGSDEDNDYYRGNRASLFAYVCDLCNHAFPAAADLKAHIVSVHNVHDAAAYDPTELVSTSAKDTTTTNANGETTRSIDDETCSAKTSSRSKPRKNKPKKKAVNPKSSAPHECDVCGKQFMRERWLNKHKTALHATPSKTEVQGIVEDVITEIISRVVPVVPGDSQSLAHPSQTVDSDWTPDDGDAAEFNDVARTTLSDDGFDGAMDTTVAVKSEISDNNMANNSFSVMTSPKKMRRPSKTHPRPKPKQTPFRCPICNRYLASENRLKVHMVLHRSDDDLRCYECDKTFTRKANLKAHMDVHMQLRCDFCGLNGQDFKSLDEHMKEHMQGPPEHKCERCDKVFYLKQTLKRHLLCHGKQNSTQCTICGHVCVNTKAFKRHMKHHTGDTFNCLQCDKKFFNKNSLKWHMLYHTGEMPFTCEVCGTGFRMQVSLKHHYQRKHANMPKDFKCSVCSKAFYDKCSLESHMTSHSDVRPFTCEECGKSFKTIHQLRAHMTIHTGVKPFKCDLCPYAAQNQALLRRHQSQHATAKDFKCPHCESAFVCKRYLYSHIRAIHKLGHVRPHVCDQCGKAFRTRDHLKRHELSHSTMQPFRCTVCGRGYKHKVHLAEHHQKSGHQNAPPDVESTQASSAIVTSVTPEGHLTVSLLPAAVQPSYAHYSPTSEAHSIAPHYSPHHNPTP